jgi:chromatin segregation and condensation protein Rec8/ScpA/Scc1 (kleisin family)
VLQRRAALASTLLAGLELSRDGIAVLEQNEAFDPPEPGCYDGCQFS